MSWLESVYRIGRAAFVNGYGDNENIREMAERLWRQLDSNAFWFFYVMAAVSVIACWFYYGPCNNKKSGRPYRLRWLVVAGVLASVIIGVLTFVWCNSFFSKSSLDDVNGVRLRISLINSALAIAFFAASSLVTCLCFPTNAYRWTKRII